MKSILYPICLCIVTGFRILNADDNLVRTAVYKIKSEILPDAFSETLTDHIESELTVLPGYKIISRSNLDVLISEDHLLQSGITNDDLSVLEKEGRSSVDKICTGAVSRIGKSYSFTLKMIDVGTGRIDASAQKIYSGPVEGLLDVGSNLLERITLVTPKDTIRKIPGPPGTLSFDTIRENPVSENAAPVAVTLKKEVQQSQDSIQKKVATAVPHTGHSATPAGTEISTDNRPSGLSVKISIGAAVIFGTLAALVVFARNN